MESSVTAEGPLRVAWCQPFTCSPLARWEHKQSPARTLPIADYLCLHPRCEPINLLSLDHFDQALFDFYRILPFCFFSLNVACLGAVYSGTWTQTTCASRCFSVPFFVSLLLLHILKIFLHGVWLLTPYSLFTCIKKSLCGFLSWATIARIINLLLL